MPEDDGDKSEEIEVTPEIIQAGADVLWSRFSDVLSPPSETALDVAVEVYRAMAAIPRQHGGTR